jgi:hypothetical protein
MKSKQFPQVRKLPSLRFIHFFFLLRSGEAEPKRDLFVVSRNETPTVDHYTPYTESSSFCSYPHTPPPPPHSPVSAHTRCHISAESAELTPHFEEFQGDYIAEHLRKIPDPILAAEAVFRLIT